MKRIEGGRVSTWMVEQVRAGMGLQVLGPSGEFTADAVILVERVNRVADAVRVGRRALAIARQSVLLGLGASLVAMGFAAAGFLPPVMGALIQEVIDVGVILNALRALRG